MSDKMQEQPSSPETTKTETPETTGKPIRKAGSTNLGWAKPDDPAYKEGWTIMLGGLRGRSQTPTSSTPAKTLEPTPPVPDEK